MRWTILLAALAVLAGCDDGGGPSGNTPPDSADVELRGLLQDAGVTPLAPLPPQDRALVALGHALMFDKVLSGNRDVSCATCHDPAAHTSDAQSLSIGTGGIGTGAGRSLGTARAFVSRNAQDLFNRGDPAFTSMFWDGRVARTGPGDFRTPAGAALPSGLSGPLAAQAMFPVFTRLEMRGHPGDRDRLGAPTSSPPWGRRFRGCLARAHGRLLAIDGYVALFQAAYPARTDRPARASSMPPTPSRPSRPRRSPAPDPPSTTTSVADTRRCRPPRGEAPASSSERRRCAQCHRGPELPTSSSTTSRVPQLGPGFGGARPRTTDMGGYRLGRRAVYLPHPAASATWSSPRRTCTTAPTPRWTRRSATTSTRRITDRLRRPRCSGRTCGARTSTT